MRDPRLRGGGVDSAKSKAAIGPVIFFHKEEHPLFISGSLAATFTPGPDSIRCTTVIAHPLIHPIANLAHSFQLSLTRLALCRLKQSRCARPRLRAARGNVLALL